MYKQFTKITMIGLLACSFGVSACGDTASNNNENNTNNTTDMTPDTTGDMTCMKTCEAPAPVCDGNGVKTTTSTLDEATCMCTETEETVACGDGKKCEEGACVDDGPGPVVAPSCDDANPPARCGQMPDAATWATASVVSELKIIGDTSCCFDYNGDGEADNGLGDTLGTLPDVLPDANAGIADSIASGDIALVLEHFGLAALDADAEFSIGFLLAEPATEGAAPKPEGGGEYLINPDSFVTGTSFPQAVVGSRLVGSDITAGPGNIQLAINLLGIQLNLTITAARITGTLDTANSEIGDKGIAINDGKLGGLIRIADIFGALNDFADTNCGCLDVTGDLVTGFTDDDLTGAECATVPDTASCDEADSTEGICKTIADNCNYVGILSVAADINSKHIGTDCIDPANGIGCNALSVGIDLKTVGAKITGIVPPAAD